LKAYKTIHLERGDKVATLKIDRPPLNILNSPVLQEITDALESLKEDTDCRVLVLTGSGEKAFIGGADMEEMAGFDPQSARAFITLLHSVMKRLRILPFPVIGRINGYSLGGGCEVAMACDIRVASDRALLGLPEVRVGIPSVIDAALMPRLIGFGWATELMLTGRIMDAQEACRLGLVHQVVDHERLDHAVEEVAKMLILCAPQALRAQKELLYGWMNRFLDDSVEMGIEAFSKSYEGSEPREGMSAFFEKRLPSWANDE
jgi:enoyl-CoA hydratase/carnithine racemase